MIQQAMEMDPVIPETTWASIMIGGGGAMVPILCYNDISGSDTGRWSSVKSDQKKVVKQLTAGARESLADAWLEMATAHERR